MRILTDIFYIVQSNGADASAAFVVAPPGYYRRSSDGKMVRDGSPSPEMGGSEKAYRFKTHRAAARCANTLASATVRAVYLHID
jgi:hypothetical protein